MFLLRRMNRNLFPSFSREFVEYAEQEQYDLFVSKQIPLTGKYDMIYSIDCF